MKIKSFNNAVAVLAIFIGCGGADSGIDVYNSEPITDALTLELSFGDKDLPDEYLLARPGRIAVGQEGTIMVMDENRIKVFDENGKPVTIIGGPGEGPGEFRRSGKITIGPTGVIMAGNRSEFNIFGSDYGFVDKKIFRLSEEYIMIAKESNVNLIDTKLYYALSENELVVGGTGFNSDYRESGGMADYNILVHFLNGEANEIAKYKLNDTFQAGPFQSDHTFLGAFYWALLQDRSVAYSHTGYDKSIGENGFSYTIHVVSLDTHEDNKLTIPYDPVAIPDSLIAKPLQKSSRSFRMIPMGGYPEEYYNAVRDKLREIKYYPPVDGILADDHLLFVFTYHENYINGEIADVIDIRSGMRIAKLVFPFRPQVIKDGYAYSTKTGTDIFPTIEKYKINLSVYR